MNKNGQWWSLEALFGIVLSIALLAHTPYAPDTRQTESDRLQILSDLCTIWAQNNLPDDATLRRQFDRVLPNDDATVEINERKIAIRSPDFDRRPNAIEIAYEWVDQDGSVQRVRIQSRYA